MAIDPQARAPIPGFSGDFPQLLDLTTLQLHREFRMDYVWACLRLPEQESMVLSVAGRPPIPISPAGVIDPADPMQVARLGPLSYLEAELDFYLGRPAPLEASEADRLRLCQERIRVDLLAAGAAQSRQAVRFQEDLRRRSESERRKLKRKLYLVGHHYHRVLHDAINDLTPLNGAVEELQERVGMAGPIEIVVYIDRQAKQLHQRLYRGLHPDRQDLGNQVIDARVLCAERIEAWGPVFRRAGQSLIFALPDRALPIRASEHEWDTVVSNLLSNAHKYTPPAGRVGVHAWVNPSGHMVFEVSDTGCGISEHFRAKLFQLGEREHGHIQGSGVGLATVQQVVANLEGRIEVESEPNRGTVFRVWLPLAS
jgi:signal transduction histidine kinase